MRSLALIVGFCLALAVGLSGCGKPVNTNDAGGSPAPPKAELNTYGKTRSFEPKPGLIYRSEEGGVDNRNGTFQIMLSNSALNTPDDFRKAAAGADDVRILIVAQRKKGTDKATAPAVESFPANGSWPHIDDAQFRIFEGGREMESWGHEAPSQDRKGEVKITAVNGDTVTLQIDLKYGDKISLKGTFTAKVLPPA